MIRRLGEVFHGPTVRDSHGDQHAGSGSAGRGGLRLHWRRGRAPGPRRRAGRPGRWQRAVRRVLEAAVRDRRLGVRGHTDRRRGAGVDGGRGGGPRVLLRRGDSGVAPRGRHVARGPDRQRGGRPRSHRFDGRGAVDGSGGGDRPSAGGGVRRRPQRRGRAPRAEVRARSGVARQVRDRRRNRQQLHRVALAEVRENRPLRRGAGGRVSRRDGDDLRRGRRRGATRVRRRRERRPPTADPRRDRPDPRRGGGRDRRALPGDEAERLRLQPRPPARRVPRRVRRGGRRQPRSAHGRQRRDPRDGHGSDRLACRDSRDEGGGAAHLRRPAGRDGGCGADPRPRPRRRRGDGRRAPRPRGRHARVRGRRGDVARGDRLRPPRRVLRRQRRGWETEGRGPDRGSGGCDGRPCPPGDDGGAERRRGRDDEPAPPRGRRDGSARPRKARPVLEDAQGRTPDPPVAHHRRKAHLLHRGLRDPARTPPPSTPASSRRSSTTTTPSRPSTRTPARAYSTSGR